MVTPYTKFLRKKREELIKDSLVLEHRELGTTDSNHKQIRVYCWMRPRPIDGQCETCETMLCKKLDYHHWNREPITPNSIVLGIWCCVSCHRKLEIYEKLKKYLTELVVSN